MATGTRQKTRRFSLGVNRRLTESLLSSGGVVASIGLVTAAITLVFVIWFVLELQQQSRVGAPLARSAAVMNAAINQSVSSLRGWVAYGIPAYKHERSRVWRDEIEPTLARLRSLAVDARDPALAGQVDELRNLLEELKLVQWAIEDVAKTPGNRPATVAYETRLLPLKANILSSMQQVIDYFGRVAEEEKEDALGVVAQVARFRLAFTRADSALADYARRNEQVFGHTVLQQLATAREQGSLIDPAGFGLTPSADIMAVMDFAADEFLAYERQVQEIITLQQSSDWNVAQHLYLRDAQPIVLRTVEIAGELAGTQARIMSNNARDLTRASYLVTGMALLMGVLSAGSLVLSKRLKRQVATVMEEARMLGQYEIERLIGRGGMGEVYLGHHAMLRRPTAIKLLRGENAQDLPALARFQREVKLTCQLTHPNTVEIFDYGRTPEGVFYYAMEYLDGFCIDNLVDVAGPVEPGRVIHILRQACGSLREAHGRGFLHRDLKPSNMMLTDLGGVHDTLKILDFGLVKNLATDSDADNAIVGTPRYLAPECILNSESASARSDIYALGAVAYFMLCAQPTYPGSDLAEILAMQLEADLPFPSQVLGQPLPESLEYLVMACLSRSPAERPGSAAELMALLDACQIPLWTEEDAAQWWQVWGESAKNQARVLSDEVDTRASGIHVDINRTSSERDQA